MQIPPGVSLGGTVVENLSDGAIVSHRSGKPAGRVIGMLKVMNLFAVPHNHNRLAIYNPTQPIPAELARQPMSFPRPTICPLMRRWQNIVC